MILLKGIDTHWKCQRQYVLGSQHLCFLKTLLEVFAALIVQLPSGCIWHVPERALVASSISITASDLQISASPDMSGFKLIPHAVHPRTSSTMQERLTGMAPVAIQVGHVCCVHDPSLFRMCGYHSYVGFAARFWHVRIGFTQGVS